MNDTEKYRRECEARYVFAMDKVKREAFYKGVLGERGMWKLNQLIADVNVLKKERRAAIAA